MPTTTIQADYGATVYHAQADLTWAALIAAAGNNMWDGDGLAYIEADASTDLWRVLERGLIRFDTRNLLGATVSSATVSLYGIWKLDGLVATPDLTICQATPASKLVFVASDYATFGAAICDTPITYAGFTIDGWNDFVLNAAGLALLQADIDAEEYAVIGGRNSQYDLLGAVPPWVANIERSYLNWGKYSLPGNLGPRLIITYSIKELRFRRRSNPPYKRYY